MSPTEPHDLEELITRILMDFPGRLDEMEIRSEPGCRAVAGQIARAIREHLGKEAGPDQAP